MLAGRYFFDPELAGRVRHRPELGLQHNHVGECCMGRPSTSRTVPVIVPVADADGDCDVCDPNRGETAKTISMARAMR